MARFPTHPLPLAACALALAGALIPFSADAGGVEPSPPRALPPAAAVAPTGSRVPAAALTDKAAAAPRHARRTASSLPDSARRIFAQRDLEAKSAGGAVAGLDPETRARIDALSSPFLMRGADGGPAATALPRGGADKADAPWSGNRLLANPTDMNDEYVSLAASPLTGALWATFAATDLGGSDRDIHIARSLDEGLTWTVWEMPAASADEYHPDLAIDAAGYIHVVWVAAPGTLMRARSAAPDDPLHWAFVEGLAADEPLATPSIAVSGGGDFARVFIATAWNTVNWDLFAYEWTLLFMYSSDGGRNISYDYFVPDGYPEYWPDVAMDGSLVHFVNAEADYETGVLEIVVASDQYSGSFVDVASLTGWTDFNCLFPRLACQGQQVFVVYQHDWTDGFNTDGDIIYAYSWDRAASWYGPIEMIADPYESVGPTVFTRNGVVGCLWLDAPGGGDEFHLAARLGSGGGQSALFGGVEIVTDEPRVEPQFHAVAGLATAGGIHAAWIDRRDYPTEGHNVYTGSRPVRPDLAPLQPEGWSAALVATPTRGGRTDTWLAGGDTTFVSFASPERRPGRRRRQLRPAPGPGRHAGRGLDRVGPADGQLGGGRGPSPAGARGQPHPDGAPGSREPDRRGRRDQQHGHPPLDLDRRGPRGEGGTRAPGDPAGSAADRGRGRGPGAGPAPAADGRQGRHRPRTGRGHGQGPRRRPPAGGPGAGGAPGSGGACGAAERRQRPAAAPDGAGGRPPADRARAGGPAPAPGPAGPGRPGRRAPRPLAVGHDQHRGGSVGDRAAGVAARVSAASGWTTRRARRSPRGPATAGAKAAGVPRLAPGPGGRPRGLDPRLRRHRRAGRPRGLGRRLRPPGPGRPDVGRRDGLAPPRLGRRRRGQRSLRRRPGLAPRHPHRRPDRRRRHRRHRHRRGPRGPA